MRFVRGLCAGSAAFVATIAVAGVSVAQDPTTEVTASSEHRATKGRVLCDVEIEAHGGRIAWADVLVVAAPKFAPPLRSRVGMSDARSRSDERVRIPVAFVATEQAKGTVTLRGRAVVCAAAPVKCIPASGEVTTDLVVGPDVER